MSRTLGTRDPPRATSAPPSCHELDKLASCTIGTYFLCTYSVFRGAASEVYSRSNEERSLRSPSQPIGAESVRCLATECRKNRHTARQAWDGAFHFLNRNRLLASFCWEKDLSSRV